MKHLPRTSLRRQFLSRMGLGSGIFLLGPMFRQILPQAMGAEAARKRFLLVTHGGGLLDRSFVCKSRSETDFDLTPAMQPFAALKKDLLVMHKFYVPFDTRLHGNQFAVLSSAASSDQEKDNFNGKPPGGISIDRYLGTQIGAKDPFTSTLLALNEDANGPVHLSADGKDKPIAGISSPLTAYEKWFASGAMGTGASSDPNAVAKLLEQNKGVLELVRNDVAVMNRRLAGPERAKMDQYLETLRGIERQMTQQLNAPQVACSKPTVPAVKTGNLDPKVIDLYMSLTHAAHVCGLTRVSHISLHGYGSPHIPYTWLGDEKGFHNTHHSGDSAMIDKITTYIMGAVAQLGDKFAKTTEGDGSMLDNSLIAFTNNCGNEHHNGHSGYAMIMLGRGGGVVKTGRCVAYPKEQRPLGDVWSSVCNVMGLPIKAFGDPKCNKGLLPALVG